ncbi:hypothetical protein ACA910_012400 [Epithemia clementina (nom. ined.)]
MELDQGDSWNHTDDTTGRDTRGETHETQGDESEQAKLGFDCNTTWKCGTVFLDNLKECAGQAKISGCLLVHLLDQLVFEEGTSERERINAIPATGLWPADACGRSAVCFQSNRTLVVLCHDRFIHQQLTSTVSAVASCARVNGISSKVVL